MVKIIWHDGLGMSLYAKRLEKGRFLWPSPADGTVSISPAQLAYMLDGIDWRVTRSALSSRAEFFFEFAPFSASQRTRFMIQSRAWLPPPRMPFRTISAR
ncbi:IS66 family insertion sequence element accessory protein TnpB [Mesorhizobium sp. M0500]|uniref:IS66 family insertion sequence element accessory protein TnpB n=1 Tax=Mesorhizobium sp. M0500 TaxID=2956953 RepID=UPI00333A3A6C